MITLSRVRTSTLRNWRARRPAGKPSRQGPRHRARPRRVRAQPPSSRGSKHLGERSISDTRVAGKQFLRKDSLGYRTGFGCGARARRLQLRCNRCPLPPLICNPFLRYVPDKDALHAKSRKMPNVKTSRESGLTGLAVTHEIIGGEPSNLHNLVSGTE